MPTRNLDALRNMSLPDALTQARILSGMSPEEVGAAMGWQPSHANRVFSPEAYWPTLPTIPKLCAKLGNTLLLDWLYVQAEAGGLALTHEAMDPAALRDGLLSLFKEVGDLAREAEQALADGAIQRIDARRLLREAHDIMAVCIDICAKLRALTGDGERRA